MTAPYARFTVDYITRDGARFLRVLKLVQYTYTALTITKGKPIGYFSLN